MSRLSSLSKRNNILLRVIICIALMVFMASNLVYAQQNMRAAQTQLDEITNQIDEIEARLALPEIGLATLTRLAQTIDDLSLQTANLIGETTPKLEQVRQRLAQITDSADESEADTPQGEETNQDTPQIEEQQSPLPVISEALRNETSQLQEQAEYLDSFLRQLRLADLELDQLNDEITDRQHILITQEIFERTRPIIDFSFWYEAVTQINAALLRVEPVSNYIITTIRETNNTPAAILWLFMISLALLGLVVWLTRRKLLSKDYDSDVNANEAAFRGLKLGLLLGVPLILYGLFLQASMEFLNFAPEPLERLISAIGNGMMFLGFVRGISATAFLPQSLFYRRFQLTPAASLQGYRFFITISGILVTGAILTAIHDILIAPVSVFQFTSMLVCLAILLVTITSYYKMRNNQLGYYRPLWRRLLIFAFMITLTLCLLGGYATLGMFIVQRLLTAIMGILLLLILSNALNTTLNEIFSAHTLKGKQVSAATGLSPNTMELGATIIGGALKLFLIIATFYLIIGPWGLLAANSIWSIDDTLLGFDTVSIGSVLTNISFGIILFILGYLGAKSLTNWLRDKVLPKTSIETSLQNSIATILGYIAIIIVIGLSVTQAGIDLQNIAIIAGALSVGIGFGLQSIVSNFVSGLILLAERPIRMGDWVQVNEHEGLVKRISVRATELQTFDRSSIIIPNSELITGTVRNLVLDNTLGRVEILVGVDYNSDVDLVHDLLMQCANENENVSQDPAPFVVFKDFGASSLDFMLYAYLDDVNARLKIQTQLRFAILKAFRENNIEIPFPQRVLHNAYPVKTE